MRKILQGFIVGCVLLISLIVFTYIIASNIVEVGFRQVVLSSSMFLNNTSTRNHQIYPAEITDSIDHQKITVHQTASSYVAESKSKEERQSKELLKPPQSNGQLLNIGDSFNNYVKNEEIVIDENNEVDEYVNDNEALYNAVIGINKKNCMHVYNDSTLCQSFVNCQNINPSDCAKRLPGALIIGVFKAGTREFIDFLAMHPKIRIQRRYEIHFFNRKLYKGLEWYRNSMPFSLSSQTTIEKSPEYFSSRSVPKEIYKMNPNEKLILLVREPVSRLISHYTFDMSKPPGDRPYFNSLDQCVLKNKVVSVKYINQKCHYVKDSMYSEHLRNYLQYFRREQVHIIDSVDFAKDPCTVLKDVERFLELEPMIDCNDFVYNKEKGFYCVVEPSGKHKGVCFSKNRGRTEEEKKTQEQNADNLKQVLSKFYAPYNEEFYKIARKRFEW